MKLYFSLLLILIATTGCPSHTKLQLPETGQSIARAQALGEMAQQHVEKVVPHVFGEDKANLETAADALTVQGGQHALALKEDSQKSSLLSSLTHDNQQMKDDYFSYRQKKQWHLFLGLSITAAVLWLIGGLLIRFTTGGLSTFLLKALPVANIFARPGAGK